MRQMILIGTQAELDASPAGEYHRATAVILKVPHPDKGVAYRVLKSKLTEAAMDTDRGEEWNSAGGAVLAVLP